MCGMGHEISLLKEPAAPRTKEKRRRHLLLIERVQERKLQRRQMLQCAIWQAIVLCILQPQQRRLLPLHERQLPEELSVLQM